MEALRINVRHIEPLFSALGTLRFLQVAGLALPITPDAYD
jgi:hypothetical protein